MFNSGSSGSKSSLGMVHCIVFLTLNSHSASLHQGIERAGDKLLKKPDEMLWGIKCGIDALHPSRGLRILLVAPPGSVGPEPRCDLCLETWRDRTRSFNEKLIRKRKRLGFEHGPALKPQLKEVTSNSSSF